MKLLINVKLTCIALHYTGKMFPSRGDLHVAPFTDEALYMEQINKVNFWYQNFSMKILSILATIKVSPLT